MHLADRGRDARVGQPAQEPGRRLVAGGRAQRLDEQELDEPRQGEVAAGALVVRLLADEPRQQRQPLGAARVHDAGQERRQQRGVGRVEGEVAAEQAHVGRDVARAVVDAVGPLAHAFESTSRAAAGSRLDIVKPGVAGRRTKSPASSVIASAPSTARRQLPSSTLQKLGWPNSV